MPFLPGSRIAFFIEDFRRKTMLLLFDKSAKILSLEHQNPRVE
jgi:hypothetical protein